MQHLLFAAWAELGPWLADAELFSRLVCVATGLSAPCTLYDGRGGICYSIPHHRSVVYVYREYLSYFLCCCFLSEISCTKIAFILVAHCRPRPSASRPSRCFPSRRWCKAGTPSASRRWSMATVSACGARISRRRTAARTPTSSTATTRSPRAQVLRCVPVRACASCAACAVQRGAV